MGNINIKKSTADPAAADAGNLSIQGRVVSKTVQMACFTNNRNAVWAGTQALRKESYPFAQVSFPANRDAFRLEVGDCFLFSWAKYGVVNMICRVLQIQEEGPESEVINITAMEDIYAVTLAITEYGDPARHSIPAQSYDIAPFVYQKIIEAPYALVPETPPYLVGLACREYPQDLGFIVYMSIDGGASYQLLSRAERLCPYGGLVEDYPSAAPKIDAEGLLVDFYRGADLIDTVTFAEALSGSANVALLGDEIIFFQNIEPVDETVYRVWNIIRARYGTAKLDHVEGAGFYYLGAGVPSLFGGAEILAGAQRKFKFVPYNLKKSASIADCSPLDLEIVGVAATPYTPANFTANGSSFAARYNDDVALTWTPRKRGAGAGIGVPGVVLPDDAREGLFKIEVYVSDVLVRTTDAIDAASWTYTEAMNIADNGALAAVVEFRLTNYLPGTPYESAPAVVVCKKISA